MGKKRIVAENEDKEQLEYDVCPHCGAKVKEFKPLYGRWRLTLKIIKATLFPAHLGEFNDIKERYVCPECGEPLVDEDGVSVYDSITDETDAS